ncbi:hypothetical protein HZH68_010709 [Vespula germanica]|uniref:Ig-like domain-containing protein n=1 Tax=Vespula germanica TaxID=30212 RepID=A0A834N2Y8_VESGE|nr:hypothetical protein HZH68_010709 [Vespula germanica]
MGYFLVYCTDQKLGALVPGRNTLTGYYCEENSRTRKRIPKLPNFREMFFVKFHAHRYGFIPLAGEGAQYFRFKPRNSSVLERGEVIIPCEVENRVGIVQWVKDGFAYVVQPMSGQIVGHPRLRLIGDQNAGVYNLQITDASLTDDGEYQCQVGPHVRVKPIRANAHLTVICVQIYRLQYGERQIGAQRTIEI